LLRATDDVQREIELYFLTMGYFYDRRKNFYKNQGKPVGKIFGIQTAAQAIESIIFTNPFSARSKPTSLIKEDSTYYKIFNNKNNYLGYLNCCLILKKTIDYWSGMDDKSTKSTLSNFKLHLSRIATSFIINNADVTIEKVVNLDINSYTPEIFQQTADLMTLSISEYLTTNPTANLINIAKSKGVTDFMIVKLNQMLPK
jgi:hypothetical protein